MLKTRLSCPRTLGSRLVVEVLRENILWLKYPEFWSMVMGWGYHGDAAGDAERLSTIASNERQMQVIRSMKRSAVESRTPRASDSF